MIDMKVIRESPELVQKALEQRGIAFDLGALVKLDKQHRNLLQQFEELRAKHNQMSKQIGKGGGDKQELIAQMRQIGDEISSLQQEVNQTKSKLEALLLELPNILHPSVPLGKDEASNITVRSWGEPKSFSFKPLPHWELGENLCGGKLNPGKYNPAHFQGNWHR